MGLIDRLAAAAARLSGGPVAQPSQQQQQQQMPPRGRRVTSPKLGHFGDVARGSATRLSSGPDTDPSQWAYAHVDIASLQAPRPFQANEAMARWLSEITRDRTKDHRHMQRFVQECTEVTDLYLAMRNMGRDMRGKVGTALHEHYYKDQRQRPTFDPDRSGPYSRALILSQLCRMHHIELLRMDVEHKLKSSQLSGDSRVPVYAYLETYGTMRTPRLVVDIYPYGPDQGSDCADEAMNDLWLLNTAQWTFAAASCLAVYFKDAAMYTGAGAPVDIIAPFDPRAHAAIIPLTHVYAKALLYFKWSCPSEWPCTCNHIEDELDRVPQAHPQQTGTLPAYVERSSGPLVSGGFGAPSAPSRTMTPPPGTMTPPGGTSGVLLRQYLEAQRRETGH